MVRSGQRSAGGARTLPGRYYTSSAIFAQECAQIFTQRWLYVGHVGALANPGDRLLFELAPQQPGPEPVPHESVVVVRGADQEIRGFYNVCRHRGARMCRAGAQQGASAQVTIRCPYHGWSYGLDGRLLGAPNMGSVAAFAREDYPLQPVATAVWEGLVFVNLGERPRPFAEAFAPLLDKLGPWQLPRLVSGATASYEIAANWKLIFENFVECYHCPLIHPALDALSAYRSAANDLEVGEILGGPMAIQQAEGSLTESGARCGPALVSGPERQQVYYYTVMPNWFVSLHPDYVLTHRLDPLAIDRTRVHCEWLFHPDYRGDPNSDPEQAVQFWNRVNHEDQEVCELSQHGVRSRAYEPGPYADLESISAAFDRAYLAALTAP